MYELFLALSVKIDTVLEILTLHSKVMLVYVRMIAPNILQKGDGQWTLYVGYVVQVDLFCYTYAVLKFFFFLLFRL